MIRFRSWFAITALTTIVVSFLGTLATERPQAAAPPGPYVITDLGTLGGLSAQAYDINDAGQVVGYATTAASQARAFLWQNGVMSDLGTVGGNRSEGQAINGIGQVAGNATMTSASTLHAVLWDHGTRTDLTPGAPWASSSGINDSGHVIGTLNHGIAFIWRNGVLTTLGHFGGGGSVGADINNAGQAVGAAYTTHVTELGPMPHAFLWQNGVMTDLGVLPGEEDSGAAAINSLGQIVGSSGRTDPESYDVTSRSFLYENGVMRALPVPSQESNAGDINDAGVVVGTMRAAGGMSRYHAYVYADGVVTNLNSLVPAGSGLHLAWATGVNNAGQIVGVAVDARASYHAFLLTPTGPATPVVSIGDVSVAEGHTGTRTASLALSLSPPASQAQAITVTYGTANGSATAGSDYQPVSGTVTFAAGQSTAMIAVQVTGDRSGEANETLLVNLGQVSAGAVIADGQGVATIIDDEPRITINDVTKNEGQSGSTAFVFTVRLSPASSVATSVAYATANGSAKSGEDYDGKSGTLAFAAGQSSQTLTIGVKGDRKREGQEVFSVGLSGAAHVFVADHQGSGVIRNDD